MAFTRIFMMHAISLEHMQSAYGLALVDKLYIHMDHVPSNAQRADHASTGIQVHWGRDSWTAVRDATSPASRRS